MTGVFMKKRKGFWRECGNLECIMVCWWGEEGAIINVGGDEAWMQHHGAVWKKVEDLLGEGLTGESLRSGKYVNPKLITWDGEIRTGFRGTSPEPEDIGSCYATGVLKIRSVYRHGSNYPLQVFLKECRYRERDVIFKILLSDDEDEGYDTVH